MHPSTGFLLHPASPLHDPGWGHPDHQGRLRALASAVSKDMLDLHDKVAQMEARSATEEELKRVHAPDQLQLIRETADRAMEEERSIPLDPDTHVSGASWDAAAGSCGAVLAAVEGIEKGHIRNAFVATRPPGHHASGRESMGFCLLNHVAVGVRHVQALGMAKRILVVDWDVHHGNGTQEIFYQDPDVFFLSLHMYPHFPGTGREEEKGEGEGRGTTMNVPLPPGTPRAEYRERFSEALTAAWDAISPEFVFISAGFDVLTGDPMGGLNVEPEDLHALTREVLRLADDSARGRVVAALEGGYVPERVGAGAVELLRALTGLEAKGGG